MKVPADHRPILAKLWGSEINTPICVRDLDIEIDNGHARVKGKGTLSFRWHPFPCPEIRTRVPTAFAGSIRTNPNLTVCFEGTSTVGRLQHLRDSGKDAEITLLLQEAVISFQDEADRVSFCVANFDEYFGSWVQDGGHGWAGRLTLESAGWQVTIDQRPDHDTIVEQLEASGGYGITHVGLLERCDGQPFRHEEARSLLEVLGILLGLSQGAFVPILFVNGTLDGQPAWERWFAPKGRAWRRRANWFNPQEPQELNSAFDRLTHRWTDLNFRRAIQNASYWYDLAMDVRAPSAVVVLCQNAMEVLAWYRFVLETNEHQAEKFDKKRAADRIRLLLQAYELPVEVPDQLTELQAYARGLNMDAPAVLAKLRNDEAHPKGAEAPDEVIGEGACLALWHLEVSILGLLGFVGTYVNRVKLRIGYGLEYVPWNLDDA